MMKIFVKTLALLPILFFGNALAQTYTAEQVEKSNDPKVIANFIKNNPNHPKTASFQQKLFVLIGGSGSTESHSNVSPKRNTISNTKKSSQVSKSQKDVAALLTHMFDNDPTKKEAYIHIKNNSLCEIIVKIKGRKSYEMKIPAQNSNYLLLDKGNYTLTSDICNAKYSSTKNINRDLEIILASR